MLHARNPFGHVEESVLVILGGIFSRQNTSHRGENKWAKTRV